MSVFITGLVVPIIGKRLSDFAEGDTILISEDGVPTWFYVAKHDYEPDLNGNGRTLLVRKEVHDGTVYWDETTGSFSQNNAYADSYVDAWANRAYFSRLDAVIQKQIDKTAFYYTIGGGDTTVTIVNRSVFFLSATELGVSDASYVNVEGSPLPIADVLIPAYNSKGTAWSQWTRSPYIKNTASAVCVVGDKTLSYYSVDTLTVAKFRPCFTLPSNAVFNEDTLEFVGVA